MSKARTKKRILLFVLVVIVFILLLFATAWSISRSRTFQFFGGIVNRVPTEEKAVALTFDDGPTDKVDVILSALEAEGIKATFFLTGSDIEKHPEEARKLARSGHEIGNHTYSHSRMVLKSLAAVKKEIEDTDRLITEAGYTGNIPFRPPYGKKLLALPYFLKQQNRKTVLWDMEPNTYPEVDASSDNIVRYVVENAQPGSIILLHPMYDENETSINAIEGIVRGLKNKGYSFKTVTELLQSAD